MYMDWLIFNIVVFGFFFMVGIFRNSFVFYFYIFVFFILMKDFLFFSLKSEYVCVFMGRILIMILNFYCVDFFIDKVV